MNYSIEITPQALNEIEAAYRWTANSCFCSCHI